LVRATKYWQPSFPTDGGPQIEHFGPIVSEPLSASLQKMARGTGIALLGMFVGLLLQFGSRSIIARYVSEGGYGVFSLALAILNIAVVLATLGLYESATVYVARFRAKQEGANVRAAISTSLQLAIAASLVLCVILFFSADIVAFHLFHIAALATPLKIFAVGLPFFTVIHVLLAIFRGFDRVEAQAYFQNMLLNFLFLLLLLSVTLLGATLISVFCAYLIALVLTALGLIIYATKTLPHQIALFTQTGFTMSKELLLFSMPFLGIGMLSLAILWTDTLVLGYFKTPEIVGLYNAASPLAQFIMQPLGALLVIYTPVVTGLYSQHHIATIRRNFTVVTKWLTFITMPLFMILFLFPEAVISLFFGENYIAAAPALRLLSTGFMARNLFGPNAHTLFAMGKARFVMLSVLGAAIMNLLLNVILVPPLGITGAAIASMSSLIASNLFISLRLYRLCQAQPLSMNLLKPVLLSGVLALIFRFAAGEFLGITWWMLVLLFILYCVIYGSAVVVTRSFDREDIALLLEVEKKSGLHVGPIKKILARFVSMQNLR